jgi:capsular polysaccharide transport system permease protein
VTIFDLLFSRTLLDASSMMSAAVLLMAASAALGIGRVPARPLLFLEAWGLNFWFGLAISMSVLAGNIVFPSLDKFVHPMVYLVLPISNVFSVYEQLPASVEQYLWWWPMAQINEIVREAVFANFDSRYANPLYVAFCCASLTLFGLVALRAVRSRIVLE